MKKALILCLVVINTSCIYWGNNDDDIITEPYESSFEAVTITREAFENSTALLDAQPNLESGKIYVKDNYLVVNEPNQGFHIYNNSSPEAPVKIGFLKVLGSTDLSIKGNIIYVNNAVDLIAIKINTDFNDIEVTKRVRNVFPKLLAPDGFEHDNSENEIVLDWILKTN